MPALDGLRAVAVLAVVAFHADALAGGWLGVEVFFVLSGYLITTLALAEIDRSGTVSLRAFWGRRIRRLWPAICAYLLITLVVVVPRAVAAVPPTTDHLVATLTWRQNWQMIGDGGYGAGLHAGVVEHFWSLSIEEQFYLVWPLALWAMARWVGRRGIRPLAVAVALVSAGAVLWGVRHGWSADRLYLGSDTRVLGLAAGAAMAGVRPSGRWSGWVAGAGVVAIGVACLRFGDVRDGVLAGPLQLFTVLSVLTVVAAAGLQRGPLVWPPVRAIGRWSFGIYLWHVPIAAIVASRVGNAYLVAVITAVVATAVAAASYRLVESPVRQRRPVGRWIALGLTATAVVCVAVGAVQVQPEYASAQPSVTTTIVGPGVSTTPGDSHLPSLVVVGDSVARRTTNELIAAGAATGWGVAVDARDACVMSADVRDQLLKDCAGWVSDLRYSVSAADAVVLWWGGTGEYISWRGRGVKMCNDPASVIDRYDVFLSGLALSDDVEVAVVLPSARADQGTREQAGTECERQAITEWAGTRNLVVFDPDPARRAAGSERQVRVDGLHYTPLGAQAVTTALFDALAVVWDG